MFDRRREDAQSPVPIVAASLRKSLLDFLIDIALYIVFFEVKCLEICEITENYISFLVILLYKSLVC